MTKEQEQLVIDNHNLIYYYLKRHNLDISSYYDVCAIGLCKAAMSYDKDKSSFATYALHIMHNEYLMDIRKNTLVKNKDVCIYSLDEPLTNSKGEQFYRYEIVSNELSAYDNILPYNLEEILDKRQLQIVQLCLLGYTQYDIGIKLKLSQSYVSRILKQIKKILEAGG